MCLAPMADNPRSALGARDIYIVYICARYASHDEIFIYALRGYNNNNSDEVLVAAVSLPPPDAYEADVKTFVNYEGAEDRSIPRRTFRERERRSRSFLR